MLKRPAARITKSDVVHVLDGLLRAKKAAAAARTRAYGAACFAWALRRGKVPVNPFHAIPVASATKSRDRVLSDPELAEIWRTTGEMAAPWGPFYRLSLLTLQRREEVAGMRWSEIAPNFDMWQLPASRMKNGKPHDVYLSEAARQVLRSIKKREECDFVFTTTGKTSVSGFSKAKAALDAVLVKGREKEASKDGKKAPALVQWRLHDFRRTGVSILARLGFDSIVVDTLLAHQPTKLVGVAAVYQRYDFLQERARALDAWAAHVRNCAEAQTAESKIILITRKAIT
jgi:integrase